MGDNQSADQTLGVGAIGKPRRIVVVSDLHVGSQLALCPPDLDTERDHPLHRYRMWMWDGWETFVATVLADPTPFVLVVNGDVIEGHHHGKTQLIGGISGLIAQFRAACLVVKMLSEHAHTCYMIEGTWCHVLDDEAQIADEVGGFTRTPDNAWAWPRLKLTMNGLVHEFRHHVSATSRPWLEANQLGMSLASSRLQSLNAGERPTDVLVAAHRHVGGYVKTTSGMAVVTPSWQLPTRHVFKVVPDARPVIGGGVLQYGNKPMGAFPEPQLFEHRPEPDKGVSHD